MHDSRDLWPRDFGRDGVSGLVTLDRAMRGRDVSRPDLDDERVAAEVIDELLARVDGRRPNDRRGTRRSYLRMRAELVEARALRQRSGQIQAFAVERDFS